MVDINVTFDHSTYRQHVRTFLSEQTSHQQPASTGHQPTAKPLVNPASSRPVAFTWPLQHAGASHRRRRSGAPASPSPAQRRG
jgi:hypothetical protein